jgi:exodeoxyribonuclease V alpha subunit
MVKAFDDKVFDVTEAEPDRLREVMGIGAVRARRITDAWAEQKIVREIMIFLHSYGVSDCVVGSMASHTDGSNPSFSATN